MPLSPPAECTSDYDLDEESDDLDSDVDSYESLPILAQIESIAAMYPALKYV